MGFNILLFFREREERGESHLPDFNNHQTTFIYLLLMLLLIPIYSLFQLIHVDEIQLAVEL